MQERLLQWLVCPKCKNELTLDFSSWDQDEIVGGILSCSCGNKYPIIKGVPRLLSRELQRCLTELYPKYYRRHLSLECVQQEDLPDKKREDKYDTMDRFGFEWTQFSEYSCDNFREFIKPLSNGYFGGKLGLDVGCGAGRHVRQAGNKKAEMIGIDLSQAVEAAHQKNLDNDRVHIVQADVYNLPFKSEIFDFIYSLGVLHHLPDPENGYLSLLPYLKRGGAIFIWLYAHAMRKVALESLRFIAQRLSNKNLRRMAYFCNLIDYGIFVNLYRLVKDFPAAGILARHYAPLRVKEYATYGYNVGYTDWFDRLSAPITNYYKEPEMRSWLMHSKLSKTDLRLVGDSWWWLYGERTAEL
jgi:SAM-dependent methyltransferase/uncharacterized protein YbaR (Trm112 family)